MVRQHVNPLSRFYQQPRPLPACEELFGDPNLPLHLDIGSARGRFLLALAPLEPERNHLGVEIRRPLVQAAEADREAAGLENLRFLFCNANVSLETWLAALPPGRLQLVTIQFPDPWFKKKHHKRRVLQPALLRAIGAALVPGTELFLQSDVPAVIEPMVALVEASGGFLRPADDARPWRATNPLPLPTEREQHVLRQQLPVYRVLYKRTEAPLASLEALEAVATAFEGPDPGPGSPAAGGPPPQATDNPVDPA
jgi:tRNA (guanine-N7-)-methyltransferase